jgi:hypothetical protein
LNARILLTAGTKIGVPPIVASPPSLLTLVGTYDIGAGTSTLAYTTTPLAAGNCLYVQAAVLVKPGVQYFSNLLKLVKVSAAALVSPYDWQADVEARFGPLVVGNKVVLMASVLSSTTGLLSAPQIVSGTVVSTV